MVKVLSKGNVHKIIASGTTVTFKNKKLYGIDFGSGNILDNSLKYSSVREYTDIDISCRTVGDMYEFSFKDNGVGFDMSGSADPFTMFSRLHTSDEFKGTGVGLAAVRSIVEKHGGRVCISSEPDKGCLVVISIKK